LTSFEVFSLLMYLTRIIFIIATYYLNRSDSKI